MSRGRPGYEEPRSERFGHDMKRRRAHQLTIRLPGERRRRLDSDVAAAEVEHARIRREVAAQQPAHDADSVAKRSWREHADVQATIIRAYSGAKGDATTEHSAKIGHHDCSRLSLVRRAVDHNPAKKKFSAH